MNISEKLRRLRQKTKKTLKEASSLLDVSLNTVYRWEHNLSVPRKSVLKRIADYYGVPFEWLFQDSSGEGDMGFDDGYILNPESDTDHKIMRMIRNLPERTKYRIMGYIESVCEENEKQP